MSLKDFHCDLFDLSFSFSVGDFDKDALLKEMKIEDESEHVDEDGDFSLSVFFGSRKEAPDIHAHLRIIIPQNKSGFIHLNYHQSGTKVIDDEPPYVEDAARWLSGFFKREEFPARFSVGYEFGEGFTTTIPLPFPLVASDKALAGLKVKGFSLQYPEDAPVETAIIQRGIAGTDDVVLFIQKKVVFVLRDFDLYRELEVLRGTVNSLVKEKENGGSKQTKEA